MAGDGADALGQLPIGQGDGAPAAGAAGAGLGGGLTPGGVGFAQNPFDATTFGAQGAGMGGLANLAVVGIFLSVGSDSGH